MFNFPELADTRQQMLEAFKEEQARSDLAPYRPEGMTPEGEAALPALMEAAILQGNEMTLKADLDFAPYWWASMAGSNPGPLARRAAGSEFNTWYVQGLCRRLTDEGVETCIVVLAEGTGDDCDVCKQIDGKTLPVSTVLEGHRIRYHHLTPDREALSVPMHTECHHSVRRPS